MLEVAAMVLTIKEQVLLEQLILAEAEVVLVVSLLQLVMVEQEVQE